jgi:predicted alpha/beta superfamily hydrolase
VFAESASAFGGQSWGVHEALSRLVAANKAQGAILVGVWNTALRRCEYMPQQPFESPALDALRPAVADWCGGTPFSDSYLKFLTQELKPFIDSRYHTQPDQPNTYIMGSSMGGLVSLYAVSQYPQVFGGAACLSTHWPAGEGALVDLMGAALPDPADHKLYFDFGTLGLDSGYEPYQRKMDDYLRRAGYVEKRNWLTLKFDGADHNERSWRDRVEIPLTFLLGTGN